MLQPIFVGYIAKYDRSKDCFNSESPIHPTDGALKPVLQLWILCNDVIMAGTYSMSISHICLVSLLCYITSSVPLPNLSLTFVILYLESYCASRLLHLFLSNILLLHCTVSYPPSCYTALYPDHLILPAVSPLRRYWTPVRCRWGWRYRLATPNIPLLHIATLE